MPVTGLSFRGTTLIGARSATLANGEGHWEYAARIMQRPVLAPVELYGVAGVGFKQVGNYNTVDTARRIIIGPRDGFGCWVGYTSRANALAAWSAIEALLETTGTLVCGLSGGETWENMILKNAEMGPPSYRALGNCVCSCSLILDFVKVGP